MNITIHDIAKQAGVSITTVSLVLNDKKCRVSKETKERIIKVAKELNYKPSQIARSLATSETKTIGLIVPDITNPFFAQMAKGIGDALSNTGYTMFLANSYNDHKKELQHISKFQQHSIDGLIITSVNSEVYDETFEKNLSMPFVILDRHISKMDRTSIEVDDFLGGYMATEYLLKCGHRRIACFAANQMYLNARERLRGYEQALQDYRIPVDKNLIFYSDYTIDGGYKSGLQLLKTDATAVFASNDLMAFGLYKICSEKGVLIGDNISVIGFDDIPVSEYLSPRLTTIRQPIYEIGQKVVDTLILLIKNPKSDPPSVIFPLELIVRDSVKVINKS